MVGRVVEQHFSSLLFFFMQYKVVQKSKYVDEKLIKSNFS